MFSVKSYPRTCTFCTYKAIYNFSKTVLAGANKAFYFDVQSETLPCLPKKMPSEKPLDSHHKRFTCRTVCGGFTISSLSLKN